MDGCGLKKICFIYRYYHTYLHKFRVVGFSIPHFFPAEQIPKTKNAPGGLVAALRGHLMCVVPWRTRPAFYSISIRFGFSGKAFVC